MTLTDSRRDIARRAMAKYRRSAKGKAARLRFDRSAKGRAMRDRAKARRRAWEQTPKGKAWMRRKNSRYCQRHLVRIREAKRRNDVGAIVCPCCGGRVMPTRFATGRPYHHKCPHGFRCAGSTSSDDAICAACEVEREQVKQPRNSKERAA